MVRQAVSYGSIRLRGYNTPSVHIGFARYTIRLGSTLPKKNTLLECTWYLVSLVDAIVCVGVRRVVLLRATLVDAIVRGCTTCCVAVCDVLTDAGTA